VRQTKGLLMALVAPCRGGGAGFRRSMGHRGAAKPETRFRLNLLRAETVIRSAAADQVSDSAATAAMMVYFIMVMKTTPGRARAPVW
jgi:hypothetical protein